MSQKTINSVMESELPLLRGTVLRVLEYARRENQRILSHCNSQWRYRLREKSYASLLFSLKFVLSGCKLETIVRLFKNREIPKTKECIQAAYEIFEGRGCLELTTVKDVLREMALFRGRFSNNSIDSYLFSTLVKASNIIELKISFKP